MGGIIQARASEILKFGAKREGKGKKRKRKRAPQAYRLEQKAARAAGTLTEGDLEATWELRKRQCFGAFLSGGQSGRAMPLLMTTRGGPKSRMGTRESRAVLQDRVPASGGPVVPSVPIMLFFTSERKREGNSGRGEREGGLVEPFPPAQDPG